MFNFRAKFLARTEKAIAKLSKLHAKRTNTLVSDIKFEEVAFFNPFKEYNYIINESGVFKVYSISKETFNVSKQWEVLNELKLDSRTVVKAAGTLILEAKNLEEVFNSTQVNITPFTCRCLVSVSTRTK